MGRRSCFGPPFPAPTGSLQRLPGFDLVDGQAESFSFFGDEAFEEFVHPLVEVGVDVVVPLPQPGQQFDDAGQ